MKVYYKHDPRNTATLSFPLSMLVDENGEYLKWADDLDRRDYRWDDFYMFRRHRKRYTEKFVRYLYGKDLDIQPPWPKPEYTVLDCDPEYSEPYQLGVYVITAPVAYLDKQGFSTFNEPWYDLMEYGYKPVYAERRPRKMFSNRSVALILRRIGYDLQEG